MNYPPLLFISGQELLVVLLVFLLVLLIFGAKRVPEVMRSFGRGIKEFKKGMREAGRELEGDEEDREKKIPSGKDTTGGDKPPHGEES